MAEIEIEGDGCKIRISTQPEDGPQAITGAEWYAVIENVARNWKDMHAIACQRRAEQSRLEAELSYRPGSGSGFTTEQAWPSPDVAARS
jgi:hypothetical protein